MIAAAAVAAAAAAVFAHLRRPRHSPIPNFWLHLVDHAGNRYAEILLDLLVKTVRPLRARHALVFVGIRVRVVKVLCIAATRLAVCLDGVVRFGAPRRRIVRNLAGVAILAEIRGNAPAAPPANTQEGMAPRSAIFALAANTELCQELGTYLPAAEIAPSVNSSQTWARQNPPIA